MLIHIYSDSALLRDIRDEVEPFAQAKQPPPLMGIAALPQLKLDAKALVNCCPLLKACFLETMRLHSSSVSCMSVERAVVLREQPVSGSNLPQPCSFALKAGSVVAAPSYLHHHDPQYFESPDHFVPSRFLRETRSTPGKRVIDQGTLVPWGLEGNACPAKAFAEQHVLAFVAGILPLWDVTPVCPQGWIIPKQIERSLVFVPSKDVMVRIGQRDLER